MLKSLFWWYLGHKLIKIVWLVQRDNLAQDWYSFKERNPNVYCELGGTKERESWIFLSYCSKQGLIDIFLGLDQFKLFMQEFAHFQLK